MLPPERRFNFGGGIKTVMASWKVWGVRSAVGLEVLLGVMWCDALPQHFRTFAAKLTGRMMRWTSVYGPDYKLV